MSATKAELRTLVRAQIRDASLPYHVQDAELDAELWAALVRVAGKVTLGEKWVNGEITVTAGSDTATLPAGSEYAVVSAIRRTADGHAVDKRTLVQLEREHWSGQTAAEKLHEEPAQYALSEDNEVVTLRFQAPALTSTTLDFRRSIMPADLLTGATVVPLSALLVQAVADYAASVLVAKLPDNELSQMRLERPVWQVFAARGDSMVHDEIVRLNRLGATGSGVRR